jgi:adenine-specific DNA-methyltransferase
MDSVVGDGDDLSELYSRLNDPEDVKKLGKFYTPAPVVSHVLARLGYPGEHDRGLMDPACGTGAFLVQAARRYLKARPGACWEDLVREILGVDVDPVAVLIARARILEAALDAGLRVGESPFRVECRDALELGPYPNGTLFDEDERGVPDGGFGYVVGNPPYGKVHSSDSRIAPYKDTVHGHANLYGIFLALAVGMLGEGGRLGFVVPRSFASGLYFKNLRRHLLGALRFDEVDVFGSRGGVFPGVLQETLLLLGTKGGGPGTTVIREPRDPGELAAGHDHGRVVVVPEGKLSLGPRYDHALILSADPKAHEVMARVRLRSKPLADHGLKASTGRLVWNRVKEHLRAAPEPGALRVYWPANVRPWTFDPGALERAKPNYAVLNGRTRGAVSSPEDLVVTKRTSAKEQARRIEAGFVAGDHPGLAGGFFLENHLNFVRRVSGDADLRVVSAVLNARITNALFAMVNGNTQVSATELMHLPLPEDLADPHLVDLAAELDAAPTADRPVLAGAFERALWESYGLPEELVRSFLDG